MKGKDMENQKPFDIRRVTERDPKTGKVTRSNPVTIRKILKPEGGTIQLVEWPKGSGNLWNNKEFPEPIGRWVNGEFKKGEAHIKFELPESADQKLATRATSAEIRVKELERELNQIKAEQAKKK